MLIIDYPEYRENTGETSPQPLVVLQKGKNFDDITIKSKLYKKKTEAVSLLNDETVLVYISLNEEVNVRMVEADIWWLSMLPLKWKPIASY